MSTGQYLFRQPSSRKLPTYLPIRIAPGLEYAQLAFNQVTLSLKGTTLLSRKLLEHHTTSNMIRLIVLTHSIGT